MTATCTLCGMILTSPEDPVLDPQRDDRTFGRLGGLYRKHFNDCHAKELQQCLPSEIMQGTIPQMIGAMTMTFQASILFSYLKSDDPVFLNKSQQMRELVQKTIAQKELKPQVVLG